MVAVSKALFGWSRFHTAYNWHHVIHYFKDYGNRNNTDQPEQLPILLIQHTNLWKSKKQKVKINFKGCPSLEVRDTDQFAQAI